MTTLGEILSDLELRIKAAIPSATVYWAVQDEKNDNTPMPLFEVTFQSKESPDFGPNQINRAKIEVLFHDRTTNDKKTIEGLLEKLEIENNIREILSAWETANMAGPITDIRTDHLATYSKGEMGGLNKKIISIGLDFTISYWEV